MARMFVLLPAPCWKLVFCGCAQMRICGNDMFGLVCCLLDTVVLVTHIKCLQEPALEF